MVVKWREKKKKECHARMEDHFSDDILLTQILSSPGVWNLWVMGDVGDDGEEMGGHGCKLPSI